MIKQQRKVIHVELNEPYNGQQHYYFGSIIAIYDILPIEVVGVVHTSLWNVISKKGEHKTKTATIRIGILHAKHTNRGRGTKQPTE